MPELKTKTARVVAWIVRKLTEEHHHGTQFMTDDVRQISEHMTEEEKRRAEFEGMIGGIAFGIAFIILPLAIIACHRWLAGLVPGGAFLVLSVYIFLLGASVWWLFPVFDRWNRKNLASTEWAKSQGLKAEDIQLRKHTFSDLAKKLVAKLLG